MVKNRCGRVEIWVDGYKNEEQKRFSKTIDIVSYALEVSVNDVTCAFAVHGLTVNIHVSTKTCVTGNNLALHKAMYQTHFKYIIN